MYFTSFFDKGDQIWQKVRKIDKDSIIVTANFSYQGTQTKFALTDQLLVRYQGEVPYKQMDLSMKIVSMDDNGILLRTNSQEVMLLEPNQQNRNFWYEQLRLRCIQTNFRSVYEIGALIGQGQFANVFKVENRLTRQPYAAKVFNKDNLQQLHTDRNSMIREIKIMRTIKHPGIMKLFEVFEDNSNIFLVLELMQGSLKQRKNLQEADWANIVFQVLKTLNHLHDNNIIHRDIKPDNILFKNDYTICISDFGLADYYQPECNYQFKRCGTPGYVAPEILHDQPYGFKVDVYSTGILLYTMINGKQPFYAKSQSEVVKKNYFGAIDYSMLNCSVSCLEYIQLLLKSNPNERPSAYESQRHEWFVKALGEHKYFSSLNSNEKLNIGKVKQQSKTQLGNFQAIQNMMDSEDEEPPQKKKMQQIQQLIMQQHQLMQLD